MDRLTSYRDLVKRLLSEFSALVNRQPTPGVETCCVFDEVRDHYLVVTLGWAQRHRVRGTTLHVRLRDGKIWIEEDLTEEGIATSLLDNGVSKDDIVLAFQAPEMRRFTEFAVA